MQSNSTLSAEMIEGVRVQKFNSIKVRDSLTLPIRCVHAIGREKESLDIAAHVLREQGYSVDVGRMGSLGEHLDRLKAYSGLDHYTIDGEVKAETVIAPYGVLEIWLFRFQDVVEEAVKENMIRVVMRDQRCSRSQALAFLLRVDQAIPQNHVKIEVQE